MATICDFDVRLTLRRREVVDVRLQFEANVGIWNPFFDIKSQEPRLLQGRRAIAVNCLSPFSARLRSRVDAAAAGACAAYYSGSMRSYFTLTKEPCLHVGSPSVNGNLDALIQHDTRSYVSGAHALCACEGNRFKPRGRQRLGKAPGDVLVTCGDLSMSLARGVGRQEACERGGGGGSQCTCGPAVRRHRLRHSAPRRPLLAAAAASAVSSLAFVAVVFVGVIADAAVGAAILQPFRRQFHEVVLDAIIRLRLLSMGRCGGRFSRRVVSRLDRSLPRRPCGRKGRHRRHASLGGSVDGGVSLAGAGAGDGPTSLPVGAVSVSASVSLRASPLPSPHLDHRFFDTSLVEMKSQASSTSTLDSSEDVWVMRSEATETTQLLMARRRRSISILFFKICYRSRCQKEHSYRIVIQLRRRIFPDNTSFNTQGIE
ncbi:Uncharacterized protein GBIM_11581 [Gryllus bimaculatus]|nr:Uncharacterized protein GBIM_11581 [Gryllus bimaculatus]